MRGLGFLALAALVFAAAFTPETYSACIPVAPSTPLKLFRSFNSSAVSTPTAPLPQAGSCLTWPVTVDYDASSCAQPNGTMLLELWVTDSNGNVIDPQRTVSGLYFMAAQTIPSVSYNRMVTRSLQMDPCMKIPSHAMFSLSPLFIPSGHCLRLHRELLPDFATHISLTSKRVEVPLYRPGVDVRPEADISVHNPHRALF